MDNRVVLLLAFTVCVALAQDMGRSLSQRCTCRRVRDKFGSAKQIADIQILPPSRSCDRVEIVVTFRNGLQYCMDPNVRNVQRMISSFIERKKKNMSPSPNTTTSTNSTNTSNE